MTEILSPYSSKDYPPWADTAIRIIRSCLYAGAVIMGFGLVFTQPNSPLLSEWIVRTTGWLALLFGAQCLFANIFKRWILEWVGLTVVTFTIFVYVVQTWTGLAHSWGALASAGAIAMLFLGNILRLVDLTVFYIKYRHVAIIRNRVEDIDC